MSSHFETLSLSVSQESEAFFQLNRTPERLDFQIPRDHNRPLPSSASVEISFQLLHSFFLPLQQLKWGELQKCTLPNWAHSDSVNPNYGGTVIWQQLPLVVVPVGATMAAVGPYYLPSNAKRTRRTREAAGKTSVTTKTLRRHATNGWLTGGEFGVRTMDGGS